MIGDTLLGNVQLITLRGEFDLIPVKFTASILIQHERHLKSEFIVRPDTVDRAVALLLGFCTDLAVCLHKSSNEQNENIEEEGSFHKQNLSTEDTK